MDWRSPKRGVRISLILMVGASLAACVTPRYPSRADGAGATPPVGQGARKVGKPYQIGGVWYVPREQPNYDQRGIASWYGQQFHMKATANGEVFDMNAVTAAHTTLPLPSMVEVVNLDNGKKLVVRVNDRGPFVDNRIIDLSREAARQLGFDRAGLANVRVRYLGPAPLTGPGDGVRYASAPPMPKPIAPAAQIAPAPSSSDLAVTVAPLPPITGSAILDTPIAGQGVVARAPSAASSALRIQAGAFSSEANAQRAVDQLSPAGMASIEPLQRDGSTLYRVVLPAPADEAAAYALRDRIAGIGFHDARVVSSF